MQVQKTPSDQPQAEFEPVSQFIDARPIAIVEGQSVQWGDLMPTLREMAGGEALQEVILDRRIAQELEKAGLMVGEDDMARERKLLVENLNPDLNLAIRLLDELRQRQRLGVTRFRNLLWRNAALRALVQPSVKITETAVRHTYDLVYGQKRQVRLITTPSLKEAEEALSRIEKGEYFAEVAADISTDVSGARGGLLEPMSQADLSFPESLRQTIWKLQPDQVSEPILLDSQFAIVQLATVHEAQDQEFEPVRGELERLTRLNQERLLMERLARRLMGNLSITFFDKVIEERFRAVHRAGDDLLKP